MQKLLLFLCLLLMSKNFYSQNLSNAHLLITYQNPTNLKACTNNDALNLSIKNTSTQSIAANSIVKIKLPVGISVVSLVPGSYTSNLIPSSDNTYTFQNSAIHASNATLALNVQLKADCGIYSLLNASNGSSLSVQNEIKMDYSIAGTSYNFDQFTLSYNIAQANVKTIVTASNQTMTINDDYTPFIQEVKYYVVGNSSVNQFGIKFVVPTGLTFQQIDHISINGVNVTGYGTPTLVGSTYTLLLNASTFGMSTFNSGDVVNVYYKYKPSCLSSVQIDYSAYIMCFGNPCDFDHSFGFVNLIQSPPIVNTSFTNDNNADFCGNVTHATYVVSNAGSVYTIYNPKIKIESAYTTIQNVKVNGALVTGGLPTNLSGIFFIDLKALLTSNGHALSDLNGDGVFGEIAPLQNVTITYDIALTSMGDNCTAGIININEFKTFLQYYNSNCASTLSYTTTSNILVINNYNVSAPTLELTSGALGSGQSQTFKFCVDRKITETNSGGTITPLFIDNPILFGVDFQMPCGMSLVSASWENASSLSSTVTTSSTVNSGGTLVTFHSTNGQIPWINNELKGCFVANTTFSCTDCSSTQDFTVVSATGYGLFGNCQLKNIWACAGTSTCSSCYTPVACTTKGRINHSLFTVKRKTYGWTDNSMATPVTEAMVTANPTNYNLDGAYACDIVNIKLNGQVCGGASNFTPYITFSTYSSILTSALDFVDATLSINGVTNSISVVSIVNNAGLWTIQFTTKNGPFVDGTNLILNANFSVSKTTVSGASFPNELISGFKGAFFTNTGYVNGVAPISPDNLNFQDQNNLGCLYPTQSFRLYKVIEKITNSFNPQVKCGSSGKSEIFNLGYIGGIVGDEFPNEFRPFNQIQFPLTFTLSDATNYTVTGASFDLVGDGNTVGTNTNLNFTQTGNTITITPIGTFPIVDKMYQTSYFRFYMNIQMNCSVNQSTQNPNISQNHLLYKNYAYSNIACVENKDISYTENFSIYKPNLAFSFLNPIQSTTTNSVNYDVNISNIGGANSTDANYPWMLITYDPALVSIDVPGATVVNWNANQKFVKFNPLSTGYTISKYVQVIPLNCNVEQTTNITVQSGFDCKAFPLSSSTINGLDFCSLSTDVLQLKILKSNLNVDLFTSFSPSNLVNQCNGTFSVILQMYNDQKANITNLNLQGNPIPGLTLQNASYFYNIPTGQTFDPASFNWSQVNLANYTTISSLTSQTLQNGFSFANIGLNNLSTLNGFLANTGTTLSNFYQVKLTYTVDCNFNESSLLPFIVSALSNCNQNININSSTLINVSPLNHGLTLNITIDQSGCNGPISTNDISVQVTNPGTSTANNVYVSLFCDSDGNGLLTASDTYLSTNMISGGNLSAGQSATIGFNSTALPICGTMKYIAVVSNSTGCYCNNVPVFATKNCCLCPTSIPANNSVVTLQSIDVNVSNTYNYTITGYPTTLSNFTGNQNDPSLFIWNPMSSVWEYPDPIALGQTTYYADFKSISPTSIVMYFVQPTFPLNIQTLIYYPKIDLYGNRCSPDLLCHSTLLGQKSSTYGIPCSVSSFQNTDCVSTSASYNFNEVNCSNAVINGNNHVCVGSTNQLVCSATPASTSPWTSSSPNKATVSNTGMVTGVQVGNTMIYYQASNGCIASKQIYIDSKPVVNSITSTTASCNTSKLLTANLNTSSQTGGTYSWTPGGSTGTNNILTVYPTSTTNYSVIYTGPNGCSSSPVSINVSSVVGSVSINVPVNVCGGSAITLTATIPSTMPAGGTYTWYPGGSTGTANTLSQNPMTNVSYSVNYTVNGCTYSSGSSAVSYNSTTPKTTITTNLPTYYCTQTPTFTGTLNSGSCFQYSWEIQKYDGNVLSGSAVSSGTFLGNPGTYSFPWSTISNLGGCGHYYRVKLRTQSSFVGGCVWESYKTIFISLDYAIQPKSMTSSLEENSIENQVFIYPNPSEGIFYIDYNNLKIENIIIYSMLGEKVNEKIISYEEEEIKVDLSAYPSAVYLMKIKIGDEIVYKKLIKN